MASKIARYSISYGLAGCYMPDSISGPYIVTTRRELAELIHDQLRMYEMPARLFRDANVRRLWRFITKHGSSMAHFNLQHGANALSFHGLTEEEAEQAERENEFA